MRRFLIALCVAAILSSCSSKLDEGRSALNSGNYVQALSAFTALARDEDPSAMFYLGVMYDRGTGVGKDAKIAASWWDRAAQKGHVTAMYNLGILYKNGEGVAKDIETAMKWWRKADDSDSLVQLGVCYEKGTGVKQNSIVAFALFDRAIEYDGSGSNRKVRELRDLMISEVLKPNELEEAKKLAKEMHNLGTIRALDSYLQTHNLNN